MSHPSPIMDKLSYYRNFYEQEGVRSENVSSEERVFMALEMVPEGINSILDLGCGDGTLLKIFDSSLFKVGLDISYSVLQSVTVKKKVLACSSALPFGKNYYDIVLCTEVLEHLESEEFELTINEIQRVAKKYILITVPYKEDLKRKLTRCPICGFIFHIHLHLRNFDLSKLKKLFPNYAIMHYRLSETQEKSFPAWLLKIRREYGRRWEWNENALCPRCGFKNNQRPNRSLISIFTSLLGDLTGKRGPKWIAVLYEKK